MAGPVVLSWATEILEPILNSLADGKIFGLDVKFVLTDPSTENPEVWALVSQVSAALISSVAAVMCVIMCSIDLQRVTLMTDGEGETKTKAIVFTVVKFGVVWAIFHQAPGILFDIWKMGNEIATKVSEQLAPGTGTYDLDEQRQVFLDSVKDLDWLGQTLLVVLMLIAWLVNKGAVLGCVAVAVVRLMKIYLFTAWCPVPMALLASEHGRSFGIGFLRNYSKTILQAFVLLLSFGIYGLLSSKWADKIMEMDMSQGVEAALQIGAVYIFMGIVLCMIVMGSEKLASELVGG
ncbi:MAG: type IV secretion system protein [Propionibacteriaceae bacterium]|nr:type IV secretion system protein [Propionibacteriaceae bacterium]